MFWEKLNQNKICVILVVIICILAGTMYSIKFTPKESLSSSTVMLIKTKSDKVNQGALELSDNLVSTFEEIVKSELTISEVKLNLKLNLENKELNGKINLNRVSSSDTFEINVQDSNEENALKINKEILNVFSKRINDMYGENEVYIIDAPHIVKTIYKTPVYVYSITSAIIGMVISAIYICVLMKIEKNIKSVVDLEIEVFLKPLAQIPLKEIDKKDKNIKSELICYDSEKTEMSKAFKTLRTNLQFLSVNNEKQNKVILVTSSMPFEGKSYIASNMAISFAEIGKKVVLIDADMNSGRLDKLFNLPNNLGLSNYLSGLDANGVETNEFLNKFVKETAIKNLNLITSGTVPPNSSELLATTKMTELIKDLKVFYDIVIIDGTSCLTSTDSLILTRLVGSTVIVANYRKTKKDDILKTKRDIQNVGGKITGVVLNRVKLKKKRKSKTERKEDFAKFRINVKEKISAAKKYIKEKILDSKQKLLAEKTSEETINKEKVTVENEENKNIFKDVKEKLNKVIKKQENAETKEIISEEQKKNKEFDLVSNVLSFVFGTKEKFVKKFSEKQEKNDEILNVENEKQIEKVIEDKVVEENAETKSREDKKDFSVTFGKISEKLVKAKESTIETTKNLKENTINAYNRTKENCIKKYNNIFDKKNVEEIKEQENIQQEPEEIIEVEETKTEIIDEVKNENTVLVIVDAENGCCRVFSKECFTEKAIRGVDRIDGFTKAHYSMRLLRKRVIGLMSTYDLTVEQAKRIDSLVYMTLSDYDDCMWIDRKLPSNKAEQYAKAMATEFEQGEDETEKEYLVRCQRLRKKELEKAELDIEYKLDNLWKTRQISIIDKIAIKKFANLYDIDQKMKNDKEILKSKKNKRFYSDIIKGAENRLKRAEEKQAQKQNEMLEADKAQRQEELRLEKEKIEAEKREELERIKAEKKAEQEKNKKEKEFQKQERKRERQKQREEQRMQKELERESKEREAQIEEDLLEDNLYPKTKYNKNI